MSLCLALWDRYVRSASLGLTGLPTLVMDYDQMLSDPVTTTSTIVEFLGTLGIDVPPEGRERASKRLDPGLRHHDSHEDQYSDMAAVQNQVFERLVSHAGIHDAWTPPSLPEPPLWVDDAIVVFRQYETMEVEMRRQQRQLQAGPGFRVASWVKRVTSR